MLVLMFYSVMTMSDLVVIPCSSILCSYGPLYHDKQVWQTTSKLVAVKKWVKQTPRLILGKKQKYTEFLHVIAGLAGLCSNMGGEQHRDCCKTSFGCPCGKYFAMHSSVFTLYICPCVHRIMCHFLKQVPKLFHAQIWKEVNFGYRINVAWSTCQE